MNLPGAKPIAAPGWTAKPKQSISLIDCDVHQVPHNREDLIPYLPRAYQERVADYGFPLLNSGYLNVAGRAARTDLAEKFNQEDHHGGNQNWAYQRLRDYHLDVWNIEFALLTGETLYTASVIPDPDFSSALCSAANDWSRENWTSLDKRLKLALATSCSDPDLAVREVNRLGEHTDVVAIVLPTGAQIPYGNRFYHPIWQACQEHGLVVCIHPGAEGTGMVGAPTGVGFPTYYMENRAARASMAMAHCTSLICEGVFERFPELKFAVLEVDQYWVPGFLWKMDADWKSLREQTPWVKKLPSEYFRQHIRVGSQPFAEPERRVDLMGLLEEMHAEETLLYCSDWPHFDWDDPVTTLPTLSPELHQRIFVDNARELFGLGNDS